MPDPKPPRACVLIQALPGGAKVEIECVAAQNWGGLIFVESLWTHDVEGW